ncbi:unnamed protein product, partial [Oikopleura dioica]
NGVFRGTYLSKFFIPEYVESRVIDHQNRIPVSSFPSQELFIQELPDDNYDPQLNDSGIESAHFQSQRNVQRNHSQLSHLSVVFLLQNTPGFSLPGFYK